MILDQPRTAYTILLHSAPYIKLIHRSTKISPKGQYKRALWLPKLLCRHKVKQQPEFDKPVFFSWSNEWRFLKTVWFISNPANCVNKMFIVENIAYAPIILSLAAKPKYITRINFEPADAILNAKELMFPIPILYLFLKITVFFCIRMKLTLNSLAWMNNLISSMAWNQCRFRFQLFNSELYIAVV